MSGQEADSSELLQNKALEQPPARRSDACANGQERDSLGDDELTSKDTVAFSGRLIAASRAFESRREDGLFNDVFAERLAGREAMQQCEMAHGSREGTDGGLADDPPMEGLQHAVLSPRYLAIEHSRRLSIRTRFGDDFFEDCTVTRGIKQVVLLGAGMDTRGLRLKAPKDAKVFEVDMPVVLRTKRELLSKPGLGVGLDRDSVGVAEVIPVEADLHVDGWQDKLLDAGFDPSCPSGWIAEGLIMYLEEPQARTMLRVVDELCSPGSGLCVTFVSKNFVATGGLSGKDLMTKLKFGVDDPEGFMRGQFPEPWYFKSIFCGTHGEYPNGADYGIGFSGAASPMVFGFSKPRELLRG